MEITIAITLEPEDRARRDDPERVADCLYYQLVDAKVVHAGTGAPVADYRVTGYRFVGGEPERDEDGTDLDVLPEGEPAV